MLDQWGFFFLNLYSRFERWIDFLIKLVNCYSFCSCGLCESVCWSQVSEFAIHNPNIRLWEFLSRYRKKNCLAWPELPASFAQKAHWLNLAHQLASTRPLLLVSGLHCFLSAVSRAVPLLLTADWRLLDEMPGKQPWRGLLPSPTKTDCSGAAIIRLCFGIQRKLNGSWTLWRCS